MYDAVREIIEALMRAQSVSRDDVNRVKMRVSAKYQLKRVPPNSEIIRMLNGAERAKLLPILRRKAVRAVSGVTVVAVMAKPHPCPQPEPCAYCPGGPRYGVPQSYTGFEPATMRGLQNDFDPYLQVRSRMEQLRAIGHDVDKVELIIMGGTFPATPIRYQTFFIKRCLDAITGLESADLEEAKKNAEVSKVRNVGVTVETRPDWAKEEHVDQMLNMGVTRVELGVQNPNDGIYGLVGRSHTVHDVIEATRILKDAGLKVVYHIMPGLPGSSFKEDLKVFKDVFSNPSFRPDMIKIYPCLVLEGTKVHKWYCEGKYRPYSDDEAVNLIAEVKRMTPPWIRVMRIQRDIPSRLIIAGVRSSNLHQLVQRRLKELGLRCRCVRCREVGHRAAIDGVKLNPGKVDILITRYKASGGDEIFISVEDAENDVLVGYLRLRIPSEKAHRPEIKAEPCSVIRELRVCGPMVPVGGRLAEAWQHKGYGGALLTEAERITAEEYRLRKILVMSALGTKRYYMRFGYRYDGVYMSKRLN